MSKILDDFAKRVTTDPHFLAYDLHQYATRIGITDAGLAAWLGCDEASLTRLRLCGRPRDWREVEMIAAAFGVDARRLETVAGVG